MHIPVSHKLFSLVLTTVIAAGIASPGKAETPAQALPFTDMSECDTASVNAIGEAYWAGLTSGTSATTFGPEETVSREQMATFVTRTLDGSSRFSRRASMNRWAMPKGIAQMGTTELGGVLMYAVSDGGNIWVADASDGRILKVEANSGRLLETWTGASGVFSLASAMGKIYGVSNTGALYEVDPQKTAGDVRIIATTSPLLAGPTNLIFDGSLLWVIGYKGISLVNPQAKGPWSVITQDTGFQALTGAIYDGTHIWVTDFTAGTLLELDENAVIIRTVAVGSGPMYPAFDGINIYVPKFTADAVSVVHAANGKILGELTGNGLNGPESVTSDGERILVTNFHGDSVSIWHATNLKAMGEVSTGVDSFPTFACSDGINFWITLQSGLLVRF